MLMVALHGSLTEPKCCEFVIWGRSGDAVKRMLVSESKRCFINKNSVFHSRCLWLKSHNWPSHVETFSGLR